jgi:hypothetical protein
LTFALVSPKLFSGRINGEEVASEETKKGEGTDGIEEAEGKKKGRERKVWLSHGGSARSTTSSATT